MKIFKSKTTLLSYMMRNMFLSIILITLISIVSLALILNYLLIANSDFTASPYMETEELIVSEDYENIDPEKVLGPTSYFYVFDDKDNVLYMSEYAEPLIYSKEEINLIPTEKDRDTISIENFHDKEGKLNTRVEYASDALEITLIDFSKRVIYSNILDDNYVFTETSYECFIGKNSDYSITRNPFTSMDGHTRSIVFFNHIDQLDTSVGRVLEILFIMLSSVFIIIVFGSGIYLYQLNRKVIQPIKVIGQAIQEFDINKNTYDIAYKGLSEFSEMIDQLDVLFKKLNRYEANKNMYIANISHDIKTPLTVIKGFTLSLYNEVIEVENYKRTLLEISKQSDDITKMINTLGEYSQLNSGQLMLNVEDVNILDFTRNYLIDKYTTLELQGVSLIPEIEEGITMCSVDQFHLKRVFNNIIDNSIKYNEANVTIYFNVCINRNEGIAVIRIGDDGCGIEQAIRHNIFEAFITGNHGRKSGLGTGLGMAIANNIIKLHGGSIKLMTTEESDYAVEYEIHLPISKDF